MDSRVEQQVPPLRFATVGMTILFRGEDLGIKTNLSSRPERSEVEGPAVLPRLYNSTVRSELARRFSESCKVVP
jgi:hypothetical protein